MELCVLWHFNILSSHTLIRAEHLPAQTDEPSGPFCLFPKSHALNFFFCFSRTDSTPLQEPQPHWQYPTSRSQVKSLRRLPIKPSKVHLNPHKFRIKESGEEMNASWRPPASSDTATIQSVFLGCKSTSPKHVPKFTDVHISRDLHSRGSVVEVLTEAA